MAMTREEKLAYQRGYAAGSRHSWPEHMPPEPPVAIVARLMRAAKLLRDAADNQIAAGSEQEESLGPGIDAIDESLTEISQWLKSNAVPPRIHSV